MTDPVKNERPLPRSKGPLPPVYFFLALAIMVALDRYAPMATWLTAPWTRFGFAFVAFGVALAIWANRLFHRRGTTVKPFQRSSAIVAQGPFRFTRNPMYLGMITVLTGTAIYLGTLIPILVIPAFMAWITIGFIQKEEAGLELQFGEGYLAYKREVRRWL